MGTINGSNKATVNMLDKQGRKVTVRECRLQIYLDLGWTVGWPEDEEKIDPESKIEATKSEAAPPKVIAEDEVIMPAE